MVRLGTLPRMTMPIPLSASRDLHGRNMLPDGCHPGCERDHTIRAMQLLGARLAVQWRAVSVVSHRTRDNLPYLSCIRALQSWRMLSKRAPTAEAVSRTIAALEKTHRKDDPELVEKIRRQALLRLSDRLTAPESARPKILIVRAASEEQ
jgi:hypothetical protein